MGQPGYGAPAPAMGGMVPAQSYMAAAGGMGAMGAMGGMGAGGMPMNAAGGHLMYEFQFKGSKLADKDLFSKSDPFLIMYASRSGRASSKAKGKDSGKKAGDWVAVHKTETIKNNLNPTWRPFQLDLYNVCGGRLDAPIMIEVLDWDANGRHDLIGRVTSSVREMQIMKEVTLVNPANKNKMFSRGCGSIQVLKCAPISAGATHVPATTVTTATTSYQAYGAPPAGSFAQPQGGSYYPPQQPVQGSYYAPPPAGAYPPQQHGYPPQQQGYPPQQQGYPPQGGYR